MKRIITKAFGNIVVTALFVIVTIANTTTLDPAFNTIGYLLHNVGAENSGISSLAIQPDGKIIAAGVTNTTSGDNRFAMIRINSDGTHDPTFGIDGAALSPDGIIVSTGSKIKLQPDGKILLSGTAWMTAQQAYFFIVMRFTSEGMIDMTFNKNGYSTARVPNSFWDQQTSIDLGADGKIVLVGQTLTLVSGQPEDWDLAIMRFNEDGTLDTTFDGDGIVKLGTVAGDEGADAVMIQTDGKIIVGGRETTDRERYLLTRLNVNGSVDTSFGTNGWTIFTIDTINNNFTSIARLSDGRFLAGGGGKIMRFSADGIRDVSFAGSGVQADTGTIEHVKISVIAGDKFLVSTRYGVRRYMTSGAIDTHYGSRFMLPGNFCFMTTSDVQTDGKVLIGGNCSNSITNRSSFTIARFQENRTKRFLDFNGDEKTDISIYRPSNGQWWFLESPSMSVQKVGGPFGTATDIPVPGDFTGDGKADFAIWRPSTGEWFILRSDDGTFYSFPFGTTGDIPIVGDFDEDQLADAGVYRPSNNQWYIQRSIGDVVITTFGMAGDKPIPSDYDGDFQTDIAIYRASAGEWWIQKSSDGGLMVMQFGTSTDIPVPGDYSGDNKTDAAFYRPQTGEWFVLRSDDYSYFSLPFGLSDDLPTPGNFAGDDRYDFVVFRPSTNRWHILPSDGSYFYKDFGSTGDIPLPTVANIP